MTCTEQRSAKLQCGIAVGAMQEQTTSRGRTHMLCCRAPGEGLGPESVALWPLRAGT